MRLLSIVLCSAGVLLLTLQADNSSLAQSPCSITINAGERGNIATKTGDVVTVCLPLTAGTGYTWQVEDGRDAMTLSPSSTFERGGSMPGARGTTRFTLTPQTPGDYTLAFMLVPPGVARAEVGRALVGLHVE